MSLDEALAEFEEEVRRWNGTHDGLVRFGMAIESNAHWVAAGMSTEDLICRGYELARRLGLKITAHISGGTFSLEKGFLKYLRETGRTDVRYLMQLGILDPHWVLIHGIHATELDIEQMARVGCSFVYTPTSESIRGGGISPFANAQRAGVNVALGTDGPMVDYSVDMVEQMKVCTLMQHVRHLDPTRMPVERTLEMATINAAKALGLEQEIGSLEAGKRADIAIFDLSKPYVGVLHRPLSSFVCAGKGSDVRAVLVDGQSRLSRRHVRAPRGSRRRDRRGGKNRQVDREKGRLERAPRRGLAQLITGACDNGVADGCNALALVPVMAAAALALRRRADGFHGVFDRDLAGLLEFERALDTLALLERLLQPDEHHVIGAGLELHGLARLDLEPLRQRPHLHHAAVHRHLVDLEFARALDRPPDQAVRRAAGVDDRHVAARDRRPLGRGARPGMLDLEQTGLVVVRLHGARGEGQHGGEDNGFHELLRLMRHL